MLQLTVPFASSHMFCTYFGIRNAIELFGAISTDVSKAAHVVTVVCVVGGNQLLFDPLLDTIITYGWISWKPIEIGDVS